MTRTQGLWLCLLLLGLLLFLCTRHHAPAIEVDLAERSRAVLDADNMTWAAIHLDGRDVTLTGAAPAAELRAKAGALASAVWGVRTVDNQLKVDSMAAAPAVASDPAATQTPAATAEEAAVAAVADSQTEVPAPVDEPAETAATETETETNAEAAVGTTPAESAEAAAVNCQQQFNRLLEGKTSVLFESNRSVIKAAGRDLLQEIATVAESCPAVAIEIGGHTDSRGSDALNQRLSEARARVVKNVLAELGMRESAMTAVGYGDTKPLADNASAAGRAQNRRVELIVKGL